MAGDEAGSQPLNQWDRRYLDGARYSSLPDTIIDHIVACVPPGKNRAALDIGCGRGEQVAQLAARGFDTVGVDSSIVAIDDARQTVPQATFIHGGIASVEGSYGLILCKHVFAFIEDKPTFISRIVRLLAPDGIVAILTPTLDRIIDHKPRIATDRVELYQLLATDLTIVDQQELPSGLLVICKHK